MSWELEQSRTLYNIDHWGQGYFDINESGKVVAKPHREQRPAIDLYQLVAQIKAAGLRLPVLVRFDQLLQARVRELQQAFAKARQNLHYRGQYVSLYPIKVNQQRRVVEEILKSEREQVGLEVGSKAELMAALGLLQTPGQMIVCNGYKDETYIRLALLARQLNHQSYIVIERLSELERVLKQAKVLQVMPKLGVRVRLAAIGKGKWQNSGGDKSKFGLTASQVLQVLARLQAEGLQQSLQLLHFHMGSQVSDIDDMVAGFKEAARFYAQLWRLGIAIHTVDVGGGLGVDYEGTRSRSFCSINYDIQEYANTVTAAFAEITEQHGLKPPRLCTEAGRAMSAHHAVLISEVVDVERQETATINEIADSEAKVIRDLWQAYQELKPRNAIETYHRVCQQLREAQSQFMHGLLTLNERARAEALYTQVCQRLQSMLDQRNRAERVVLDELNEKLADKLFANFSLFQSVPDVWAIEQVFPILPLAGLQFPPTRRALLQDITCDSDGCFERYVEGQALESTWPLPEQAYQSPFYFGVFLVGAYQEILGDIHNLFGDTDSVHVTQDEQGKVLLQEKIKGDSISDLLRYVHFEPKVLLERYREQCTQAALAPEKAQAILDELSAQLEGYAYLQV